MPQNNQCILCVHFWGSKSCDAFPEGIPDPVLAGEVEHDKPLPGQGNNITFEEKPIGYVLKPEGF